jgi:hypothetical protein
MLATVLLTVLTLGAIVASSLDIISYLGETITDAITGGSK